MLAAGEGKRLRPLTLHTPKPLVEVLGKPLLTYTFDSLPDEIDEVVLIVGYREAQIRERYGGSFGGKKITYITQPTVTGTGGALFLARPHLSGERFVILCADDLYRRSRTLSACSRMNSAHYSPARKTLPVSASYRSTEPDASPR